MLQIKENVTVDQYRDNLEKTVVNSVKDIDNVVFSYEVDIKKIIKKINIRQIINKNPKFIKRLKNIFLQLYLQHYLKDTIKDGHKKTNRYKRNLVA